MKRLLLLRHAKSSWADENLDDHDRPLNNRGRRDAPRIGRVAAQLSVGPQRIVCSTAARCRETLERSGLLDDAPSEAVYDERVYHAAPRELHRLVAEFPDECGCVLLIGHNPGMEEFISGIIGEFVRMPTAALAYLDFDVDHWSQLGQAAIHDWQVWRPKELSEL